MLLDRYIDHWDIKSRHDKVVDAPPEVAYRALREMDLGRSLPVMALFAIRGLPHLLTGKAHPTRSLTLDTFMDAGFVLLAEEPENELVLGAVGRFWRPDSAIERIQPGEFEDFDRPGFAKAAMNLTVAACGTGSSILATETRVLCVDAAARKRFLLYWRLVGPFSGAIRHEMLRQAKRAAEANEELAAGL